MKPLTTIPDVERANAVRLIEIAFDLHEMFWRVAPPSTATASLFWDWLHDPEAAMVKAWGISIAEWRELEARGGTVELLGGGALEVQCAGTTTRKGRRCKNPWAWAHSIGEWFRLNRQGGYCHVHDDE